MLHVLTKSLSFFICLQLAATVFSQDSLDWKLLEAAYSGDTNMVARLIEDGADPNATTYDSTSALMYASAEGYGGIVWILLEAGAEPDLGTDFQSSPLISATLGGYPVISETLLAAGANPNLQDLSGMTALMYAAALNDLSISWLLVQYGASTETKDNYGQRAVHHAALNGSYESLALLIDQGAQPCPADQDSATPLHIAASYDDLAMVELLLKHSCPMGKKDKNGIDAAGHAVIHNSAGAAALLLESDSNKAISWRSASLLSLKTGQRRLYKLLRDSAETRIAKPVTYANGFDIYTTWNSGDHFLKGRFQWIEGHSNFFAGAGFGLRLSPVRVIVQEEEGLFQYRERRKNIQLEAGRIFSFNAGKSIVIDLAPCLAYGLSWGNYRGVEFKPSSEGYMLAQFYARARWNWIGLFAGASYSGVEQDEISQFYIDTGISFRINRLNIKKLSHIL